jgi:hypothetical protein
MALLYPEHGTLYMSPLQTLSTGIGQPSLGRRLIVVAAVIAVLMWSVAVVAGMQWIWSYKNTPGSQTSAPAVWPGSSLVKVEPERATLMMFVHPLCACTGASLVELREALDAMDRSTAVWIVLLSPRGITEHWDETKIANIAERIPEATIVTDVEGRAADEFGASTSGHVVAYNREGRLTFSGGITGARGHIGDNEGRRGLVAALHGSDHAHEHPIFGCGLDDPDPIQQ